MDDLGGQVDKTLEKVDKMLKKVDGWWTVGGQMVDGRWTIYHFSLLKWLSIIDKKEEIKENSF